MYNMVLRYINTGTKYHILYSLGATYIYISTYIYVYVRVVSISTLLLVLVLIFRTPHIEALSLHFRINCLGYIPSSSSDHVHIKYKCIAASSSSSSVYIYKCVIPRKIIGLIRYIEWNIFINNPPGYFS